MKKTRKVTLKRKPAARKKPAAAKRKPAPRKKPAALKRRKAPARPKAKPAKKSAPLKGEIARVVAFFRIPVVAVLKVAQGPLKPGDRVWIRGHTTDLKQTVTSMQVDHKPIPEAKKGMEVGVKVSSRVRRGDRVYRIA